MSPKHMVLGLAGWLALACCAEAAAPPARERTDLYGDPLPPGAVARLGTLRLRTAGSSHFALSPDGRSVAADDHDGVVVWDAATGKPARRLKGTEYSRHVAFSPSGKLLASGGGGGGWGAVRFWDTASWEEVKGLRVKGLGSLEGLAFSHDGKRLALSERTTPDHGPRGHIRLWDVAGGRELCRLQGYSHPAPGLAFSPCGNYLATAAGPRGGNSLRLWEVATGRPLHVLGDGSEPPRGLAFTPDGKALVTGWGEAAKAVRVWDTDTGKEVRSLRLAGGVGGLALSPDGKTLATAGAGKGDGHVVRLHDLKTGREKRRLAKAGLSFRALAFSRDGKRLAAGGDDLRTGKVCVWDAATGKEVAPFEEHAGGVWSVAYAPDGRRLATAGGDGTVRVWDAVTGRSLGRAEGDEPFRSLAFLPDGKGLLTAGGFKASALRLWDVPRLKPTRGFKPGAYPGGPFLLTPDGKGLVTLHSGDFVVWDLGTSRVRSRFAAGGAAPAALALSLDGKTLVSAGETLCVWDLATGKKRRTITPEDADTDPNDEFKYVACSPDGRLVAAGTYYGAVCVWQARTGERLHKLLGPVHSANEVVGALAFSPDGRVLASVRQTYVHGDSDVRLWEVATGKERRSLSGHRHYSPVRALAFAPDGRTLASAGADSTVLVWDMRLGAGPRPAASAEARLPALWAALADADAAKAYRAQDELAARGDEAVTFLRRLPPVSAAEAKKLAGWVADLDADDFEARRRARAELARRAGEVEELLWKAAEESPSAEARRAAKVLARLSPKDVDWARSRRAVEVLEHVGTPAARKALERLAAGAAGARLTLEAQAALRRLG